MCARETLLELERCLLLGGLARGFLAGPNLLFDFATGLLGLASLALFLSLDGVARIAADAEDRRLVKDSSNASLGGLDVDRLLMNRKFPATEKRIWLVWAQRFGSRDLRLRFLRTSCWRWSGCNNLVSPAYSLTRLRGRSCGATLPIARSLLLAKDGFLALVDTSDCPSKRTIAIRCR